jgi:hypothetical protein
MMGSTNSWVGCSWGGGGTGYERCIQIYVWNPFENGLLEHQEEKMECVEIVCE